MKTKNITTAINAIENRIRFYEAWSKEYEFQTKDERADAFTRQYADSRQRICNAQVYALRRVLADINEKEVRA